MDLSQRYISMCEKAKEIQRLCSLEKFMDRHTYFICTQPGFPDGCISRAINIHDWPEPCESCEFGNTVWLLRQDELQDMLDLKPSGIDGLTIKIAACACLYGTSDTMEQMWLRIVMEENYGKVWKDGDWKLRSKIAEDKGNR